MIEPKPTFEQALAAALEAVKVIGTGVLRESKLRIEGPRAHGVRRAARD